jgi:hypothetical protein
MRPVSLAVLLADRRCINAAVNSLFRPSDRTVPLFSSDHLASQKKPGCSMHLHPVSLVEILLVCQNVHITALKFCDLGTWL